MSSATVLFLNYGNHPFSLPRFRGAEIGADDANGHSAAFDESAGARVWKLKLLAARTLWAQPYCCLQYLPDLFTICILDNADVDRRDNSRSVRKANRER